EAAQAAGRTDARAVDPDIAGGGQSRGGRSCAHKPGVPQPPVDPLAAGRGRLLRRLVTAERELIGETVVAFAAHTLAALLGVGLELGLERSELCERRIRVGRLLPALGTPVRPLVPARVRRRPVTVTARPVESRLAAAMPAALAG